MKRITMKYFRIAFSISLLLGASLHAQVHIRYNLAGYLPVRPKSLVLISDTDLRGQNWNIEIDTTVVLGGTVPESSAGAGDHTSHPFNHLIDFTTLEDVGDYTFKIGTEEAPIRITQHPYSVFITDALRHLRTARSGTEDAFNHGFSHGGDSAAIVHVIDGAPEDGNWTEASPKQTVDCLGGWYDAGDYIKFTLTIATTVYYLLEAWESNPLAFTKVISTSELPDILDEALHGLDYLMKLHPHPDLFVIQVGDAADHNQGIRMPENDALDGQRPALSAISPVHMGLTSAALAKGSRIFREIGDTQRADDFLDKALSIMDRARQPDALTVGAYEKDATNDFYRDNTLSDNMALGAFELYRATDQTSWLDFSRELAPESGYWIGWGTYNFSVNTGLQEHHEPSRTAAQGDIDRFVNNMDEVWGIPLTYVWASLLNWNAAGAAAGSWNMIYPSEEVRKLHLLMVDLLFGRNNWGVSFMATTRLPNSVRNVYSQIYSLTGNFPHGAVALGPGDIATHDQMQQYFGTPPSSSLSEFNTSAAVFYDWDKNFMTMETVTMSQAYAIWMLALASNTSEQAPADQSLPEDPKDNIAITEQWMVPVDQVTWYLYSDDGEGGNSTAQWVDRNSRSVLLTPREGVQYPYTGFGFVIPASNSDLSAYDGFKIYGSFQENQAFRVDLAMTSITDNNYHGKSISGREDTEITILFSELQRGWGTSLDFDPTLIKGLNVNYTNTASWANVQIDSVVFFAVENTAAVQPIRHKGSVQQTNWVISGRTFQWLGVKKADLRLFDVKGRVIWKATVYPNQILTIPRFKGLGVLMTSERELLDHWMGF